MFWPQSMLSVMVIPRYYGDSAASVSQIENLSNILNKHNIQTYANCKKNYTLQIQLLLLFADATDNISAPLNK